MVRMVALAALWGCSGGGDGTHGDGGGGVEGTRDTLVIGAQSDIGQLIPILNETSADSAVIGNLEFPLIDNEFDCSLKKLPGLAKTWEWSEDGKTLRMELRDDIKWEDGTPVTAEDIAFTYDLVADPSVKSPRLQFVERLEPDARPKIVDPTHIEWHFATAYDRDTQVSHVSLGLVPKHVFGDADRGTLRGHPKHNEPLSYGPFRLAKWEPNQRLVLEPNPNFTGPDTYKAHLSRVIFRVIPEYSARLIELEAGKIDLMEGLLVADADRIREEHPNIRLVRKGWRAEDYIGWNLSNPLFQDVRVRRALAMATDIEGMIEKVLTSKSGEKYAKPAIGTITPALCGVHNDDVKPLPYDPEAAKALLTEVGWKDTDNDGVLDMNGQKLAFKLTTNTGNKRRADVAARFQDDMKKVGIEVNIEKIESNSFFADLRERKFEAALSGWSAGLFVDPSDVWHCDTPEKKSEFNFTGYCNPEVDKLIDQGLATSNPKDSAPLWRDFQAKVYEDQPYLFLWWQDEIVAIDNRFQNTRIDILSTLNRLDQWEVPADKVKYKH